VKNQDIATLIYTSGTTGKPKGVVLTQDCWVYEAEGIDEMKLLVPDDVQFFWLPLAHSFGKVLEMAQLKIGFHTAIDGRVDKIVENLGHVKPTFVAAVPRIFEKVYNKVVDGAKKAGGVTWSIFKWAVEVGREVSLLRQKGQEPGGLLAMKYSIATQLVFSKLQARFGGRLRYFVSGSAPLSREMAEFFHAAGILILEGYGLTETSAASVVNRPIGFKFGTVGQALPGTTLKIAEDGEILIKGRGVMRGYHNLPEQTAETIKDGWLFTGDIGEIDSDGVLKITDRKKDLIKTSGGK
jgi:long-chain acyl-CoA synthetase